MNEDEHRSANCFKSAFSGGQRYSASGWRTAFLGIHTRVLGTYVLKFENDLLRRKKLACDFRAVRSGAAESGWNGTALDRSELVDAVRHRTSPVYSIARSGKNGG